MTPTDFIKIVCPSTAGVSKYGAPLGRANKGGAAVGNAGPFWLQAVPLDSGGYDRGGAYWGLGKTLYAYLSADLTVSGFYREANRKAAIEELKRRYPAATLKGNK